MQKIAEHIYKTTNNNLFQHKGETLEFSKKCFEISITSDKNIFDIAEASCLEPYDYLICAYIGLLNRYPDSSIDSIYEKNKEKPPIDFKSKTTLALLRSDEFSRNNVAACNNIFPYSALGSSFLVAAPPDRVKVGLKQRCKDMLYKIYMKFPNKTKLTCKKVYYKLFK